MLITPNSKLESINLYCAMRRVLFDLKKTKIVAIFLGTQSSLSDFIPNHRRDPGIREIVGDKNDWIDVPCYFYTQNVDSMLTEPHVITYSSCSSTEKIAGTYISDPTCLKDISRSFGRSLWERYSFNYSIKLAIDKLKTEENLFELTCLILRTGSQVVPQDELAHKLVLSGMATLLHVDIDGSRSRCWVEYIPEPILSNAARLALTNINTLDKAIKEYLRRLQIGSFHDSDYSGELIARIVLLRAMDLSLLKPQITEGDFQKDDIQVFEANEVFGDITGKKGDKVLRNYSSKSKGSKKLQTGQDSKYLSPFIGATIVREFLMLLADLQNNIDEEGERDDDDFNEKEVVGTDNSSFFRNFGVSDEVLDGLVYFNQFIQMENPLIVNQQYLLHFFTRSCAMILPKGAKGADLIIPVLRTDNCMSCIVIQVKNYGGVETFPHLQTAKLSSSYLDFLNLGKIADFEGVPADDFVRLVIQFNVHVPGKKGKRNVEKNFAWSTIPESISQSPRPRNQKNSNVPCHVLWLRGLDCFEPLFSRNQAIIKNLNTILNGQRDFLSAIQYPRNKFPTLLQTSLEGARFLANSARTLATFDNVVVHDALLRKNSNKKSVYNEYMKNLDSFSIPRFSLNHIEKCTLTTNEKSSALKPKTKKGHLIINNFDEALPQTG